METTVYLVAHGRSEWDKEGRVCGQRDLGLSAEGINEAHSLTHALAKVTFGELLSSPLQRAIQTADLLAGNAGIEAARDPRLTDLRAGKLEGAPATELAVLFARPTERLPGGESLVELQARAVAAVAQGLSDTPTGASLVIVTHPLIVAALVAHHLGAPPASTARVRVAPASITAMRFHDDDEPPQLLSVSWRGE